MSFSADIVVLFWLKVGKFPSRKSMNMHIVFLNNGPYTFSRVLQAFVVDNTKPRIHAGFNTNTSVNSSVE